jgi:hypothetical protein
MALEEMIMKHAGQSRFGYVLSPDAMRDLVDTLYEFIETTRTLKAAGDRMIQHGVPSASAARSSQGRLIR